jgi:SAM-dependent methyltransferase
MLDARLAERERQWRRKPALRAVYTDLYRRMTTATVPGLTLEVGAGISAFKEFVPRSITSDISFAPWLNVVVDAEYLPFRDGSLANIVMFDVLHHLSAPAMFFAEAGRVLRPGGRVVMVEPAITVGSWPFYRFFHEEPVRWCTDPLAETSSDRHHDPWDANQAIPTLLFIRQRDRFTAEFPALALLRVEWLSLFAYPLTGGFKAWSLLPSAIVQPLLRIEDRLMHVLGPLMAFRLMAVIERRAI